MRWLIADKDEKAGAARTAAAAKKGAAGSGNREPASNLAGLAWRPLVVLALSVQPSLYEYNLSRFSIQIVSLVVAVDRLRDPVKAKSPKRRSYERKVVSAIRPLIRSKRKARGRIGPSPHSGRRERSSLGHFNLFPDLSAVWFGRSRVCS